MNGRTALLLSLSQGWEPGAEALLRGALQQQERRQQGQGAAGGGGGGAAVGGGLAVQDVHGRCSLHYAALWGMAPLLRRLLALPAGAALVALSWQPVALRPGRQGFYLRGREDFLFSQHG